MVTNTNLAALFLPFFIALIALQANAVLEQHAFSIAEYESNGKTETRETYNG